MSKRILILGGHGFIGSHASHTLKKDDHTIGVVDCYHQYYTFPDAEYNTVLKQRQEWAGADHVYEGRIEDREFLKNTFTQFQPDVVVHVATYPNAGMVRKNVEDATGNMISATANVLDLCVEHKVKRLVFASSSMAYGDFGDTQAVETSSMDPLTLYGAYKLTGEQMVRIWHQEHKLEYSILRPSAVYGTRDMITRVISKLTHGVLTKGIMTVQGVDTKLDFTNVIDVGNAFATCAVHPDAANQIFNCTLGNGRNVTEAAEMIRSRLGGEIEITTKDKFYPNRDTLNSDKLKSLGWNPTIQLEEGIAKYLDWFLMQPHAKLLPNYKQIQNAV